MSSGPAAVPGRRVWTDQGGTFTDIVELHADGRLQVRKEPSDRVDRRALARGSTEVRRGTTVATNALLERRGVPVLLVTTRGFGDAPWIGDQVRPELFALKVVRRMPLCRAVIEAEGRIGIDPETGQAALLQPHAISDDLMAWHLGEGIRSAAVVLVHGPQLPKEEERLAQRLLKAGYTHVSLGHQVAPSRGYLQRLHTTLADAALTPLLPREPGAYMKSDGGLAMVDAQGRGPEWRGSQAVLSGPAGGVVATEVLARSADLGPAIGFDMGGTSTDVSRVEGEPDRVESMTVSGVPLRVPAVRVETVAAGGGSVLSVQAGVYVVGPGSAGADPGPACYGRGGPAAVTDCMAVLGRLPGFPHIAGPNRDQPLDLGAAREALQALDPGRPVEEIAAGFEAVAVETMARAVQALAASRGVDPAAHALVAFGGAGPGHACAVARALGQRVVAVPHLAGVFSAVGIGLARERVQRIEPVRASIARARTTLLRRQARLDPHGEWQHELRLALRHVGQSTLLEVALHDLPATALRGRRLDRRLVERFHQQHHQRFGFARPSLDIEPVELRLVAWRGDADARLPPTDPLPALPARHVRACFDGWQDVPWLRPEDADGVQGPALISAAGSTVVVLPGFRVELHPDHLRLVDHGRPRSRLGSSFHPVHTAVLGARVMAVAEQMGERLARLARSVSIRERRDFSCAVFDADGHLVANAPHVPVHLGAMGATVRDLITRRGDRLQPGSAWASNDPYAGGSHLPDITVMMPVHHGGRRVAFVACRGHHVDVGGISPGSMPPHATCIEDEGFVLRQEPVLLDGELQLPAVLERSVEQGGSRQPQDVQADLEAQVAACSFGVQGLQKLCEELGSDVLQAQLDHLQAHAEAAVRALLPRLRSGRQVQVQLDAGDGPLHPLELRWEVQQDRLRLVVRSPAHPGNLNAPRAVAVASLLYVLRCLLDEHGFELPLNEGALRPLQLDLEPGGLLDPQPPAAVAGGNVETSQRLVDALLASLGALAGSQGTMNNLTVGTPAGAFYETIGGGSGAGPFWAGAHAVQVHMTNTRATDVEELEARFPVRLLRHAQRRGSGGGGRWRGGDGMVKEWLLLAPAQVALLAGRRRVPAPGVEGGGPGAPGVDERDTGSGWEPMPVEWQAKAGDRFRIRTPGGGGWGGGGWGGAT